MKFYVFLVPDKERIYPEFYPDGFKKINPAAKIEQVEEYMRAKSFVPVIYPEESLMAAKKDRVFITHSGCDKEIVDNVKEYLKSLNRFDEIIETRAGGVISSHCGPGTLGVLFIDGKN